MPDNFYERYWKGREGPLGDFALKWPRLARSVPRERGITILDFGCGDGTLIGEMKKLNPGARFVGLDVSASALGVARARHPDVVFHHIQDGDPFPIPDGSVDFLFTSEVIEHVYDTENAAREVARVLRPGGTLLLTTPYHGFLKNLAIVLFGFDRHFDPTGPHVRFFSKRSLSRLLERQGMWVVGYDYYGRVYPFSHSIVVHARKGRPTEEC